MTSTLEPSGADPHAEWCGRGSVSFADRPYPDFQSERRREVRQYVLREDSTSPSVARKKAAVNRGPRETTRMVAQRYA